MTSFGEGLDGNVEGECNCMMLKNLLKIDFLAMSPEAQGLFIQRRLRQYSKRFGIVASTWREDGHGPQDDAHRQVAGPEKPGRGSHQR
jgi:hypothetical protein